MWPLLLGLIVLAFRLRSRRPVLAHARTEHDLLLVVYIHNPYKSRLHPIVLLANSIHPGLPTHASAYAPAWGSAWANWLAYNMGMARLLWSGIY